MTKIEREKIATIAEIVRVEAEELAEAAGNGDSEAKLDALARDIEGDVERLRGEVDGLLRKKEGEASP